MTTRHAVELVIGKGEALVNPTHAARVEARTDPCVRRSQGQGLMTRYKVNSLIVSSINPE